MTIIKRLAAALLAVLCLGLAACGGPPAEIENPITEYQSPEEAFAAAGVQGILPEYLPSGYEYQSSITIGGGIAQVTWQNGNSDISLRAAKESDGNISGDYGSHALEDTLEGMNAYVTIKGESIDEIYHATWTLDRVQYALMLEVGVPQEEIMDIVNSQP